MYIGPFYFDTKELFLILATLLIGAAVVFNIPLWWFDRQTLLTLLIMVLLTKGLLPAIHNEAFFIMVLATFFLSIYLPFFQVILFYVIGFTLFRFLKVI